MADLFSRIDSRLGTISFLVDIRASLLKKIPVHIKRRRSRFRVGDRKSARLVEEEAALWSFAYSGQ
jgi:hypothetical protein